MVKAHPVKRIRKPKYTDLPCTDCGVCVRQKAEYAYMVLPEIWRAAGGKPNSNDHLILCIGCLEARLKRRLVPEDFDASIPLNSIPIFARSTKLRSRLRHRLQPLSV